MSTDAVSVYVDLPYACFGLEAVAGRVTDAAPIARWTVGRRLDEVRRHYERRGLRQWIESPIGKARR